MVYVWCLSIVALVVGVASEGALDPSSAVMNAVGSPSQGGAPSAGAPASKAAATYFDPMAATAPAPASAVASDPALSEVASQTGRHGTLAALGKHAPEQMAAAPDETGDFMEGFFNGYFQKVTLLPGEKTCLRQNIEKIGEGGAAIMVQLIALFGTLMAKEQPNMMAMMGQAGQVVSVVTSAKDLATGCVKADAMFVMNISAHHLANATYVKGRLLANGIDITRVLADAVPAWAANNYEKVGKDFGTLLRKILLSKHTKTPKLVLPPGMLPNQVGPAVVNGIIEGMFQIGSNITITSSSDPEVDIFVDLHRCIAKEAPYFSTVMNALYLAVAQISTNIEQWQLKAKGIETSNAQPQSNWMGEMSGLMSNIPTLMQRCGVTAEQRTMMARAIKSMDTVQMAFGIPGPTNRTQAGIVAAEKFETAEKAWKVGNYSRFGYYTGGLLRDLLLVVYPQKYHVDKSGRLRAYVDREVVMGRLDDFLRNPATNVPLLLGTITSFTLLGLALFRVVRKRGRAPGSLLEGKSDEQSDMENWDDCEAVE